MRVVARSRVGDVRHRDAGGWTRRKRASMVRRWRDRSYGGRAWRCWPVHTDARIRHALRRSAGGRLCVGMGCRTGILRPDSRDHLQAAISTAWSRPIDPPAAARLSLGQAGEFTKCLLSGDFVLLHRNRRRSPLSGHVAFLAGLLPTMRVPAIGNPGRDGSSAYTRCGNEAWVS